MRKNRMMRAASALMVAVLLTTSTISGTFAKYVTTESGSDTARVAKWGVDITADSFGMFATDYKTTDTFATFTGDYSVSSADDGNREDVLAPGTGGSFVDIAITGTPEVAVDVAVVATVDVSDNWEVAGDFYCPIIVTVGGEEISGLDYASVADFEAAIEAKIESYSKQYAPNTDLSGINTKDLDISWRWDFEGATGSENNQTDEQDTALGNKAVGEDLTISIGVEITVTQID